MKKIVIPAILAATVLVAGMFAFMPVQKASTVHTAILAAITASDVAVTANTMVSQTVATTPAAFAIDAASTLTVTATGVPAGKAAVLRQITCAFDDGTNAADADINTITALGEPLGATYSPFGIDIIVDNIIPDGDVTLPSLGIAFTTTLVITADADDADADNAIDCTLVIDAPDAVTFTAAWT